MHRLNWDDLRIFLRVARAGQQIAAARMLRIDHTTVARRIAALEQALGVTLLVRSTRGVTLTADGATLRDFAERMEGEALELEKRLSGRNKRLTGIVRVTTPTAFGFALVAPNIPAFFDLHPQIEIELVPDYRPVNLQQGEADIAVSLSPPPGRIHCEKLADYRLGLYAAQSYLDRHGSPSTVEGLQAHPLVWYIDELIELPELRYFDQVAKEPHAVFRSSSIAAQQNAVAAGLGFGLLHSFAAAQDSRLVPVFADTISVHRAYWMTTSISGSALPRIRAVMSFLRAIVEARPEHFTTPK
jgi:DNA-binding transcriptional LysR family regulator